MKKKIKSTFIVFLDILLLSISFLIAYAIRFDFGQSAMPDQFFEYIPILLVVSVILKLITFSFFKLYHSLWKYASVYEFLTVIMASAVSNGLLFLYIFFVSHIAPKSLFIITAMLDVFFIGGSRIFFRISRR